MLRTNPTDLELAKEFRGKIVELELVSKSTTSPIIWLNESNEYVFNLKLFSTVIISSSYDSTTITDPTDSRIIAFKNDCSNWERSNSPNTIYTKTGKRVRFNVAKWFPVDSNGIYDRYSCQRILTNIDGFTFEKTDTGFIRWDHNHGLNDSTILGREYKYSDLYSNNFSGRIFKLVSRKAN